MILYIGTTFIIRRQITDVDAVNIDYSANGGDTWTRIASDVAISHETIGYQEVYQDLAYPWVVDSIETLNGVIRVTDASDSNIVKQSNNSFVVLTKTKKQIKIGSTFVIRRHFEDVDAVNIDYSANGGDTWTRIASDVAISHETIGDQEVYQDLAYPWIVDSAETLHGLFRVSDSSDSSVYKTSSSEIAVLNQIDSIVIPQITFSFAMALSF